ncbi:MAG: transposase [Gemmatimonadales bacterium]|nr:transposase [Gemmatimonadales bacterium]
MFVVKRRKFSIEQVAAALRQVEMGLPVADLVRQLGISELTFHRWKKVYGGLQPVKARDVEQSQARTNTRTRRLRASTQAQGLPGRPTGIR